jgi:hypothetical protein
MQCYYRRKLKLNWTEQWQLNLYSLHSFVFLFYSLKVSATDSDGFYNQISYSIVSGSNEKFAINSTTGEIMTNATLDREAKSQFILTVRAQDSKWIVKQTRGCSYGPGRLARMKRVTIYFPDHEPSFEWTLCCYWNQTNLIQLWMHMFIKARDESFIKRIVQVNRASTAPFEQFLIVPTSHDPVIGVFHCFFNCFVNLILFFIT